MDASGAPVNDLTASSQVLTVREYNVPFASSDIMAIKAFESGLVIVRKNGRVYLQGVNDFGQLCQDPINNVEVNEQ